MNVINFVKNNANSIITGVSMAGVAVTAGFAIHDTLKATEDIKNKEPPKKIVKHYIPTIVSGVVTMTTIFANDRLNAAQKAGMLTTLVGAGGLVVAKKDKIIETANYILNPCDDEVVTVYEDFSPGGGPGLGSFTTTLQKLYLAEYRVNRIFAMHGRVYLSDFYKFLDLEVPDNESFYGNNYCWDEYNLINDYDTNWIDFMNKKVMKSDGTYYYVVSYLTEPVSKNILEDSALMDNPQIRETVLDQDCGYEIVMDEEDLFLSSLYVP